MYYRVYTVRGWRLLFISFHYMKKAAAFMVAGAFAMGAVSPAFAQTATSTTDINALITSLQAQIATLQAKISALQSARAGVETSQADVQETLKVLAGLRQGMTSEQVAEIQAIFAADASVYPEGLVTGYYGPLTAKAIEKFKEKYEKRQEKFNERMKEKFEKMRERMAKMEERHEKRMEKMEEKFEKKKERIEEKFARKFCHIPPGLLRAPGYQKTHQDEWNRLWREWKRCVDDDDNDDNNGTTTVDITAPTISSLITSNITHNSAKVSWTTNESATNKVYYATVSPLNLETASVASTASSTTYHEINLTGLSASTTYYFVAESKDAAGNTATSSEQSFSTLAL